MKLSLKDYQLDAVDQLVRAVRKASADVVDSNQAVVLTAPTGAGKTVIATALIERLMSGDETNPPNPDATFLWLSDQPQINEQSRRKMLESASDLDESRLVVIDSNFDGQMFESQKVYFLNTQRIGKEKLLVTHGDSRRFSIWETIQNTITQNGENFFLFVDEAHRGMSEGSAGSDEVGSIVQKFIKGFEGEIDAVPIVVGISATPERFMRLLQSSGSRVTRPVDVDIAKVRASGLIKDVVKLFHTDRPNDSDYTLLRAACESLKQYETDWEKYCKSQNEPGVKPILIVQVEDGRSELLTQTDLKAAIDVIEKSLGKLPEGALAHSFQEHTELSIDRFKIRHLPAYSINSDRNVKVVFFKTGLNTGWDCPRAEVIMSFRRAVDSTNIAQLVGRLLRTPLARRIGENDFLNSVALFLPRYDEQGLKAVIARLSANDDFMPPVDLADGNTLSVMKRSSSAKECFSALETIPSAVMPKRQKTKGVRRLMKLARLLANDGIFESAVDHARGELVKIIGNGVATARKRDGFKAQVANEGRLRLKAVDWLINGKAQNSGQSEIELDPRGLEVAFESVGRRIGEGLHKAWLKSNSEDDATDIALLKRELLVTCTDDLIADELEKGSQEIVQAWLSEYRSKIRKLCEASQQSYTDVLGMAAQVEYAPNSYPVAIESPSSSKVWEKHLYVSDEGLFPADFNSWETDVIQLEIERAEVIGWYRNPPRKLWSFAIDYEDKGTWLPMFPDFVVFRRVKGEVIVDLLDPHLSELADAPAKAKGLAKYAAKFGDQFGRIEVIRKANGKLQRLDLNSEKVRTAVLGVATNEHLRQLFDSYGA